MGQYDQIWKEIIENLFEKFMYFYMPDLAVDVDFSKGYTFLDKEFSAIEIKSEDSERFLDKLIKVYLKSGEEQWILIHTEVQFAKKSDFSERMFKYFYRVYDKYNRKIVSIAIFTGTSLSYQRSFDYNFYQTKLLYEYRSIKLVDYEEDYLLSQENPFALATLAVKYSIQSKTDEELRYKFKRKLIRLMNERGYTEKDIKNIFDFIEIMLELEDKQLNKLIYEEIKTYRKEEFNVIITQLEKVVRELGIEEGIEKGIEKGKIEVAKKLLDKKFTLEEISEITELSVEKIKELKDKKTEELK
jgi:predicted transposase/invertase (TIGR01784 family)